MPNPTTLPKVPSYLAKLASRIYKPPKPATGRSMPTSSRAAPVQMNRQRNLQEQIAANQQRANQAYTDRMNAMARYYGGVTNAGTMANLRKYEQMLPQYGLQDQLAVQRLGMPISQYNARYGNNQRLQYEKYQNWKRDYVEGMNKQARNHPMYEEYPDLPTGGNVYAGGYGGGYGGYDYGGGGGGGYTPPLPEWYLQMTQWKI